MECLISRFSVRLKFGCPGCVYVSYFDLWGKRECCVIWYTFVRFLYLYDWCARVSAVVFVCIVYCLRLFFLDQLWIYGLSVGGCSVPGVGVACRSCGG